MARGQVALRTLFFRFNFQTATTIVAETSLRAQRSNLQPQSMDCFVASLLANDVVLIPDTHSRSRGALRPSCASIFRPREGVGNAGCPLHPAASCAIVVIERTRVTTSTPESPVLPHAMVLTVSFVLCLVTGLFCHRHPRIGLV